VLPVLLLLAPAAAAASAIAAVNALVLLSLLATGVISLLLIAELADRTAVLTAESCCAAALPAWPSKARLPALSALSTQLLPLQCP
jgi:hypothetical protein